MGCVHLFNTAEPGESDERGEDGGRAVLGEAGTSPAEKQSP